jgi:chromosome segregation ATPase
MHVADSDTVSDGNVLRRAPRVREEEVRQAADALLLDGDRPTVERVRQRLGRGSPNTIALFLDRWWTQLGARLRDLPGQELPGVPPAVSSALVSLWSSAIDEARGLLKDTLAAQSAEIETRRIAVERQTLDLARELNEFARERAALEQTVAVVQDQLAKANERHEADLAAVRELRAETAKLLEQRERLQREVLDATTRLEAQAREHEESLRQVRERAEASEKHWIKQVDEVRQALVAERKRAEQHDQSRLAEILRATTELAATQAERQRVQQMLTSANEALATARAEISRLEEGARLHQSRADELAQRLEAQTESIFLSRDELELRLREALTKALTSGDMNAFRRRFPPADKTRR